MNSDRPVPAIDNRQQRRFPFFTVTLVVLLIVAGIVATLIKLEQDRVRTAAFLELSELGFIVLHGNNLDRSVSYNPRLPARPPDHLHKLPSLFADWIRPHDLGLSPGLKLQRIDLRGAGASDELVEELKARFPQATIFY